jgi:hypothetical protein
MLIDGGCFFDVFAVKSSTVKRCSRNLVPLVDRRPGLKVNGAFVAAPGVCSTVTAALVTARTLSCLQCRRVRSHFANAATTTVILYII